MAAMFSAGGPSTATILILAVDGPESGGPSVT